MNVYQDICNEQDSAGFYRKQVLNKTRNANPWQNLQLAVESFLLQHLP